MFHYTVQPLSQYSHSHTLYPLPGGSALNEEMITPFQRQAVLLCLEGKKELKIRSNNNNPRNTGGKELVGGFTHQARPASHTRVTVTSLQIAMDTNTLPQHYSLLHKRTLTESGSRLCWAVGGGEGRSRSIQGKVSASKGWASACHFQLSGLPWSPGYGQQQLRCGKGLPAGRTSRMSHSLGTVAPVRVAEATMSCAYCVAHLTE